MYFQYLWNLVRQPYLITHTINIPEHKYPRLPLKQLTLGLYSIHNLRYSTRQLVHEQRLKYLFPVLFWLAQSTTYEPQDKSLQNLHFPEKTEGRYHLRCMWKNPETDPYLSHKFLLTSPSQHPLQFCQPCGDLQFQFVQVCHQFRGRGVLHRHILHLFVLVDG